MGFNDKYRGLRICPPKLKVVKNAREVVITTISAMCDNVHTLKLKKNSEGDFKMNGCGFALSNWQFKFPIHDIEWEADAQNWDEVFRMINSGTSTIEKIKSR